MTKIGVIVGREWSFPPAFIEEVNQRQTDVTAEYAQLGGTRMDEPLAYRCWSTASRTRCPTIGPTSNTRRCKARMWSTTRSCGRRTTSSSRPPWPLAWALPARRPWCCPTRNTCPASSITRACAISSIPFDWQGSVDYLGGFPIVLKDAHGGGWKQVHICRSLDDLYANYNQSGLLTMVLQEFVQLGQLRPLHVPGPGRYPGHEI